VGAIALGRERARVEMIPAEGGACAMGRLADFPRRQKGVSHETVSRVSPGIQLERQGCSLSTVFLLRRYYENEIRV